MHGIEDVDQCEVRETGERNVVGGLARSVNGLC